jgi:putative transport protein
MEQIATLLHRYPELALFLSIVIGHFIGKVHFKGVGFGTVVGTLIAGIVIGIIGKPVLPDLLRWAFFYLFLFAVGYSVGPQFFGSLRRETLPQVGLAVVIAVTGLASAVGMALLFNFDDGTTVGLLSGALTQSAALGTGLNAIAALPLPDDMKVKLAGAAPLADAITYGFGDLGLILYITALGPLLLRLDLKREAQLLEARYAGANTGGQGVFSGAYFAIRAYQVENAALAGSTVGSLEDRFASGRLAVQRLKRRGQVLPAQAQSRLEIGDLIAVSALRGILPEVQRALGAEADDPDFLSVPVTTATLIVTQRYIHGKTLSELGADRAFLRGIYLESVRRGEEFLPRAAWTKVERGDMLKVVGAPEDIERAAAHIGFFERDHARTDLAFVAGGICVGVLLGMLTLKVDGVPLGLGTAGSILVVGLIAGWARSRYPVFGAIPEPAQRLLADIGLIVFIAVIGLNAGPHALHAYQEGGGRYFANIFIAGVVVTLAPLFVATLVGRYVFRMKPLLMLAGIAGAMTCTPGLNALREASGSNVVALGYTVPYAVGNILLTVWGPVVVAIMQMIRG